MKELLEALVALERNVEAEIEVQTGIQALLDQQLEILLRGKTERLTAVLNDAEAGVAESRRLEAERAGLLAQIAAKLGLPAAQLTLKLLEERLGADAAALADKGAGLKALLERIRGKNRQVGLLLRHSALFLEDLVRVLTGGAATGAPTYTREGAMKARAGGTVVAEA